MSEVFAVVYVTSCILLGDVTYCFIYYFQVSAWQILTLHVLHPSVNIANLLAAIQMD